MAIIQWLSSFTFISRWLLGRFLGRWCSILRPCYFERHWRYINRGKRLGWSSPKSWPTIEGHCDPREIYIQKITCLWTIGSKTLCLHYTLVAFSEDWDIDHNERDSLRRRVPLLKQGSYLRSLGHLDPRCEIKSDYSQEHGHDTLDKKTFRLENSKENCRRRSGRIQRESSIIFHAKFR